MRRAVRFYLLFISFLVLAGGVLFLEFHPSTKRWDLAFEPRILYYNATLHHNGTLQETFTYKLPSSGTYYHELYRPWKKEVRFARGSGERVIPVDVSVKPSEECVCYASSSFGQIEIYHGKDSSIYSSGNIEKNEMGVYSRYGLKGGVYVVSYVVRLYYNVYFDGTKYLFLFSFRDYRKTFDDVRISITGFDLAHVYTPVYMKVESAFSDTVVVTLKEDYDGPLLTAIIMNSIPENMTWNEIIDVEDVFSLAENSISKVNRDYRIVKSLYYVNIGLPLTWVITLFALFISFGGRWGSEKEEMVRYAPPFRRPPWIVSYIFVKYCSSNISFWAFIATLLDLHRRGIIKIEDEKRIRILSEDVKDPFEKKVVNFLKNQSDNNLVVLKKIKEIMGHTPNFREAIRRTKLRYRYINEIRELLNADEDTKRICRDYFEKFYTWVPNFIITSCMLSIFLPFLGFTVAYYTTPSHYILGRYFFYCILYAVITWFGYWEIEKSKIYVQWKGHYYKEKLQWEAYKRTILAELSRANRSTSPTHLDMDQLIYGLVLISSSKEREPLLDIFLRTKYGSLLSLIPEEYLINGCPSSF